MTTLNIVKLTPSLVSCPQNQDITVTIKTLALGVDSYLLLTVQLQVLINFIVDKI